jgi:hypothetical protein
MYHRLMMAFLDRLFHRIRPADVVAVLREIASGAPCEIVDVLGDCEFRYRGWRILFCTEGDELEGIVNVTAPDGRWRGACPLPGFHALWWGCLQDRWDAMPADPPA